MVHILLLALAAQAARYEPAPPPRDFLLEMQEYFDAEVTGAKIFVTVGGLALATAAAFAASDSDELRSAAIPVGVLALGQIAVGAVVWWRTAAQVEELTASYAQNPAQLRAAEAARMRSVARLLRAVKIAEVALMGIGLGLAVAGGATDEPVLAGVGLGLLGQSTITLSLDMFAASRALRYRQAIAHSPAAR